MGPVGRPTVVDFQNNQDIKEEVTSEQWTRSELNLTNSRRLLMS